MPKNLFGGPERELSPEEMRFHFYELASQGKMQDAINEADSLQRIATNQMDNVLRDISGAIKYLQNGFNEHPNRIDICNECTKTGVFLTNNASQQNGSSSITGSFGQPSRTSASMPIPQASKPLPFGQPSNPMANAAFGLPSKLGSDSAFSQPSFSQTPSQSTFGRPSMLGEPQTAFGQPSGVGVRTSPFGRASQSAAATFSQPKDLFSSQQQQLVNSSPFTTQPINQERMQVSPSTNQSPFATSSGPFSISSGLQQASGSLPLSGAVGFGQSNSSAGAFGQASGGGFGINSGIHSITQGFSAPPQRSTNNTNPSAFRGMQGKLQSWKGRQVQYFDSEPCYREDDGFWQRIWFPDGPPAWNKPEVLPTDLPYNTETEERFKLASDSKRFSYGLIPLVPPRREWTNWDF
ncbi:MAG: hypothetical protein GOMPHAMPRED_004409 [Gomphillus americanus]|uniref:Uncharacterized protein n=1 Tax=Gomphillus americanus TaxID=1940652 RepID=A0A8H3FMT1_9LECA|nr:MAG: hypothetical protein GOMPHAMPRED_004409 [Gomphillus americanus]